MRLGSFTHFDSCKGVSAHAVLRRQWAGTTTYFERTCANPGDVLYRMCALHNQGAAHTKQVRFNTNHELFEVQPYSESYGCHPHVILATAHGWKKTPLRADPFTSKSTLIMKERRRAARRHLRGASPNIYRKEPSTWLMPRYFDQNQWTSTRITI